MTPTTATKASHLADLDLDAADLEGRPDSIRGHDERGIFPGGTGVGGAAVRFTVDDPDAWGREAAARGLTVVWPIQDATWGRFLVLADPDGRSVVLARMRAAT